MVRNFTWGLVALAPLVLVLPLHAAAPQGDKDFKVEGKLTDDDPKDKVLTDCPSKAHDFKMKSGMIYVIELKSTDFDAVLRLEMLGEDARHQVGRAAGAERDHDGDGLLRERALAARVERRHQAGNRCSHQKVASLQHCQSPVATIGAAHTAAVVDETGMHNARQVLSKCRESTGIATFRP